MKSLDPIQFELKHFRELLKLTDINLHPHYYSNLLKIAGSLIDKQDMEIIYFKINQYLRELEVSSLIELEYFLFSFSDYDNFFKVRDKLIYQKYEVKVYSYKKILKIEVLYFFDNIIMSIIDKVNERQNKIPIFFNEL